MTPTWMCPWRSGYVSGHCAVVQRGQVVHALSSALSLQQAANIVRALELFVKSDVLSGENAYMCAR